MHFLIIKISLNLHLGDVKVVKLKISLEFVGTTAEVKVVWVKTLHFVFMGGPCVTRSKYHKLPFYFLFSIYYEVCSMLSSQPIGLLIALFKNKVGGIIKYHILV